MTDSGQNLCGRPKKNVCTVNVKLWYIMLCPVTNWEERADAIAARPRSFKQGSKEGEDGLQSCEYI
jgi:hypothetical protein